MSATGFEQCDLLIVGAGPAGLAAAEAAAPSGASIVVIDANPAAGGQIWRSGPAVQLPATARRLLDTLGHHNNVQLKTGTRVVAVKARNELLLEGEHSGFTMRWHKLILCTGSRELLLPFPGWTLPGVTGAGGLQALIKSGLPVAGERVVVAGSGPLLLATAATARACGAQVLWVAEQAGLPAMAATAAHLLRWPSKAWQAVTLANRQYRTRSRVLAAIGRTRVEGVRLQIGRRVVEQACERVACGFGLVPDTLLAEALGCSLGSQGVVVDDWQATSADGVLAAGECTGIGGSERAQVQGAIAGFAAVGDRAAAQRLCPLREHWNDFAACMRAGFVLDPVLKTLPQPDTLVCRCEDVAHAALAAASDWPDAKLHTRCGMGACQGRVCGAATGFLFGWAPPAPRPPLAPARIATLAGVSTDTTDTHR
jgi:NADPH-dependent 2,4-dienoyl-CoA reductase/sulfur reductase-like enzyme